MNQVWLQGRLTSDPEGGTSAQGVEYATFAVALERKTAEGKQTTYVDCVAFRQTADVVGKHFGKGDAINVVGAISVRDWTDSAGVRRRKFEVIVDRVGFPVSGRRNRGSRPNGGQSGSAEDPVPAGQAADPADYPA